MSKFCNDYLALLAALLLAPLAALHAVEVRDVRCDYLANPHGIDSEKPGLSWKMEVGDQHFNRRWRRKVESNLNGATSGW